MSNEGTTLDGRIVSKNATPSDGEFTLSKDERQLIDRLQSELGEYSTPPAKHNNSQLANIDVVKTRSFDTHARLVIDIDEDGYYTLQLFDTTPDAYERRHFSAIFLNGKQIEIRDGGLELFDVLVTIYRTHNGQFIASIWG